MNTFGLDIEQLDPDEAKSALLNCSLEQLPGAPPFLSKKECATILGVSMKVINNLINKGQLPIVKIPDDSPESFDLFDNPIEQPRVDCILRYDLVNFLENALFCNKPILD
jgi:hypothetical protein